MSSRTTSSSRTLGTLGSAAIVLFPALLLLYGFSKVKSISRERTAALEEARRVVAGEILQARPDLSPKELGRLLHTSEDTAIELMAHAQVGGLLGDAQSPAVRFRFAETDAEDPSEAQAEPAKAHRRE